MHKLKHLYSKVDNSTKEELFCEALEHMTDEDKHHLYITLAEKVYNGHLSEEDAHEWVESMQPKGKKWSLQETTSVMHAHNLMLNENDWFAVLNMMYNDYFGDVPDTTDSYVKLAKSWFEDKDIHHPEHKTFNYYHKVVK